MDEKNLENLTKIRISTVITPIQRKYSLLE